MNSYKVPSCSLKPDKNKNFEIKELISMNFYQVPTRFFEKQTRYIRKEQRAPSCRAPDDKAFNNLLLQITLINLIVLLWRARSSGLNWCGAPLE
ncbi:hypothetical protein MA16_Dca021781 [Dendrobium catenatum]|uniref:Uncharacterized protein n=1 Tax=Dendrobium catenatum TaxID=906689 RepID=A0A2I0VHX9_9ASPA|nr:hypothetical protein MA16_Dca021781 [Dendrobium catenatum]